MNAETETRLPALLQPAVQNATRWLSVFSLLAIGLFAFRTVGSSESLDPERRSGSRSSLRIDINQAGQQELTLMPGIGKLTAQRILEDRNRNGPFRSLSDLQRVPGVGPKTIRDLSPYCQTVSQTRPLDRETFVAER